MITVTIVGTGNVAQVLFQALNANKEVEVRQVVGRSREKLAPFDGQVPVTTNYQELISADVHILAVSDNAIATVAKNMPPEAGLVVHTSGATPLSALENLDRSGVFYPLQTFTKGILPDLGIIPICVEARYGEDEALLLSLASTISGTVRKVTSAERKILHLCAVFVNNFTNYMYIIGTDICEAHGLDAALLQPLIQETARKTGLMDPKWAQTGPARRGDQQTMHAHLDLLQKEEHKQLYIIMSNAIKKHYGEKL